MGSVKDLSIITKADEKNMGVGVFKFTDDYSVFDYGKMPDTIPGKGESLCRMAAYNFEQVARLGIKSHYRKLVSPKEMEVDLVRVLYPQKGEIKKGDGNYLIPLEVMFRNFLPEGSSLLKRFRAGTANPSDHGLSGVPEPDEMLPKPILDVSTKLEPTDRYLSWGEAAQMSGITMNEIEEIQSIALKINGYLNEKAESTGIKHADGKIEVALTPERKFIVVDVFGTLDENRFLYNGIHLSKQVIRDYYKAFPWYEELEKAKAEGRQKEKWPKPKPLPKKFLAIVTNMYRSTCEAWVGRQIWKAPQIDEVIDSYNAFIDEMR